VIKLTNDRAALVDTEIKWIAVAERVPPRGAKILAINERFGSARLDNWSPDSDITHWHPLPTFRRR